MILDDLRNADRYASIHPGLPAAFAFLRSARIRDLPAGRHAMGGPHSYVNVDEVAGRGRPGAVLEAHREFIDVQYTVAGEEEIGWRPTADCREAREAYHPERDIVFYRDTPSCWLAVPPGRFAVFYPEDAHAPLAGMGPLRKIIVKLAVRWPA